jgi:hypothetical protein
MRGGAKSEDSSLGRVHGGIISGTASSPIFANTTERDGAANRVD